MYLDLKDKNILLVNLYICHSKINLPIKVFIENEVHNNPRQNLALAEYILRNLIIYCSVLTNLPYEFFYNLTASVSSPLKVLEVPLHSS